jgi:hypothetical protein
MYSLHHVDNQLASNQSGKVARDAGFTGEDKR